MLEENKDVSFVVEQLKSKFDMYFIENDIYHLFYYIRGFLNCKLFNKNLSNFDEFFLNSFDQWMCDKNNEKVTITTNWANVIYEIKSDNESRIKAFFKCFEEFTNYYESKNCEPDSSGL